MLLRHQLESSSRPRASVVNTPRAFCTYECRRTFANGYLSGAGNRNRSIPNWDIPKSDITNGFWNENSVRLNLAQVPKVNL